MKTNSPTVLEATDEFADLINQWNTKTLGRSKKNSQGPAATDYSSKSNKPARGTNGLTQYRSQAGTPGSESIHERDARERFWRSLGKKICKGTRVK